MDNALRMSSLKKEVARSRRCESDSYGFSNLVGYDGGIADAVKLGRKAATSSIPVLITGETGTGKEVLARAIHGESSRAGKPFVAVNCGAIPQQLIESKRGL